MLFNLDHRQEISEFLSIIHCWQMIWWLNNPLWSAVMSGTVKSYISTMAGKKSLKTT